MEEKPDLKGGQTPESPPSHQYDDHATPPPLSRNSSVTPPRDARTSQQTRDHEEGSPPQVPEPRSSTTVGKEDKELIDRRSSGRNDHPTSQAHTMERRVDESQWSKSRDLPPKASIAQEFLASSAPHAANGEESKVQQSPPLAMHPERARLMQKGTHALPPRPETEPRRPRSARPRYSLGDSGSRGAPVDSRSNQRFEQISFHGDRHERPPHNRGSSLIDRIDGGESSFGSLRDRVKVPMKRPSDEMGANEGTMDVDDGHEGRRIRRRGGKLRKARRGGA